MTELIIFDLDGTLLDTSVGLNVCMNEALLKLGLPEISLDDTKRFVGNGIKKYCERAIKTDEQKTADECYRLFMDFYRTGKTQGCRLYDGMGETLEALKKNGVKLAVLSNKAHEMTVSFYNEFLRDYDFDCVLGNTDKSKLKPSPAGVFSILGQTGATPKKTLLTGDGETDVLTAKNAAIGCLSALWGFRSKAELLSAGATTFVNRPTEIIDYALNYLSD